MAGNGSALDSIVRSEHMVGAMIDCPSLNGQKLPAVYAFGHVRTPYYRPLGVELGFGPVPYRLRLVSILGRALEPRTDWAACA